MAMDERRGAKSPNGVTNATENRKMADSLYR